MDILPQRVTDETPARAVASVADLDMAALPDAASAMRNPFDPAELVQAFDFTGGPTIPIETFIS